METINLNEQCNYDNSFIAWETMNRLCVRTPNKRMFNQFFFVRFGSLCCPIRHINSKKKIVQMRVRLSWNVWARVIIYCTLRMICRKIDESVTAFGVLWLYTRMMYWWITAASYLYVVMVLEWRCINMAMICGKFFWIVFGCGSDCTAGNSCVAYGMSNFIFYVVTGVWTFLKVSRLYL